MTKRIDHVAAAESDIASADDALETGADDVASAIAAIAQVHATLALVEQQRIANTIALAGWQDFGSDGRQARIASFNLDGTLREDIREGLGL